MCFMTIYFFVVVYKLTPITTMKKYEVIVFDTRFFSSVLFLTYKDIYVCEINGIILSNSAYEMKDMGVIKHFLYAFFFMQRIYFCPLSLKQALDTFLIRFCIIKRIFV